MTLEQAVARVVQWQEALQTTSIKHGSLVIATTFSAGIAAYPDDGSDIDTLVVRADQALYHSKKEGRNRVTCFRTLEQQCA
jgi:diguanylate cyclase (GGDEF)-like protein